MADVTEELNALFGCISFLWHVFWCFKGEALAQCQHVLHNLPTCRLVPSVTEKGQAPVQALTVAGPTASWNSKIPAVSYFYCMFFWLLSMPSINAFLFMRNIFPFKVNYYIYNSTSGAQIGKNQEDRYSNDRLGETTLQMN